MSQSPSLNRLLAYENPELIARFRKDTGLSKKDSETVFGDMLRYLWLCQRSRDLRRRNPEKASEIPPVLMMQQFQIVDEMWHAFVLYTQEYAAFCEKYFGSFIHHVPTPTLRSRSNPREGVLSEHQIERLIRLVWEELGADVARRWFRRYPDRFSKKAIKRLQLKAAA